MDGLRSILERVLTAELERQGHPDLEFVFVRPEHEWNQKDPPMRRFAKGDKVLAPWISSHLPLAEVLEVYEAVDGHQALLIVYAASQQTVFYGAESLDYVGDRKFIAAGPQIYRVSTGEVVASSDNWANIIADFLETFTPPFPGERQVDEPDSKTVTAAHEYWRNLNSRREGGAP
jgi:hypothetical protein